MILLRAITGNDIVSSRIAMNEGGTELNDCVSVCLEQYWVFWWVFFLNVIVKFQRKIVFKYCDHHF